MAAATPLRPIPGAFFNTPGPGTVRRRLNFNEPANQGTGSGMGNTLGALAPTSSNGLSQAGGQQTQPKEEVPPVVRAAQCINRVLQRDESYPDIDSYCRRKFRSFPASRVRAR
jgi:nuclear pore complex protein Nup155